MLSPDVEIASLSGRHLHGWLDLLVPPGVHWDAKVAVVFVRDGQVLAAAVAGEGPLEPSSVPFSGTGHDQLEPLRKALEADTLFVIEDGALGRLMADAESSLRLSDDYTAQGIAWWRALKRELGTGIHVEPRLLEMLPVVPFDALQRTFDLLVPDNTAMAAYVFSDDKTRIEASIIAKKAGGDITRVAAHRAIDDIVDERRLARNWQTQYKRALAAIEERFAKPSVALFMERGAFYRVVTGPTDQLAKELSSRGIIIDPTPAWLMGLLGGATAVALATRGARALSRFVPLTARRAAAGIAQSAQDRLRESGAHPFALLGFDPIDLWLRVRHVYRVGSKR
jgi:hypothetical protein